MTGTTATPSGQAPSQPASTSQSGSASTSTDTLLGGDPATTTTPNPADAAAAAKGNTDANANKDGEGKDGKNADGSTKPNAPEKYDFKFADDVLVDKSALEAFSPVLREAGLTQEQAQKLADVYAAQVARQTTDFQKSLETEEVALEQASQMLAAHRDKWADAVKNDKEIGGKNFEANVGAMQKALARFGDPALKQLLNATGLGNHPALARFCLKVGQAISEDNPIHGNAGGGARKSAADVFYGDQASGS
jgi:hypothetical protein